MMQFLDLDHNVITYLNRSRHVGPLPAQIDLSSNGQSNEKPVTEAVVIYQLEDIFHRQVYKGSSTLQKGIPSLNLYYSTRYSPFYPDK